MVRVAAAGIFGSVAHSHDRSDGYTFMVPHPVITIGHEFAGHVIRAGAGTMLAEGARVTVMSGVDCGSCANCLTLPESVDTELGALTEPLCVGAETHRWEGR
jgi:threonine dehydrogenase-like Zn-dependent dehydrogenase